MFGLDFLPDTPEKFCDRFWPDQDRIVFSRSGAGRGGIVVDEKAAYSAVGHYFAHYQTVTRQLKWILRGLALLIALILFAYRNNFQIGSVIALLLLILLMLLAMIGMNIRLIAYRRALIRPLLQGPTHAGLPRSERIERGYSFSIGALAIIAGLIAVTAAASFAVHSMVLRYEARGYLWLGPTILLGTLIWRFFSNKVETDK